MNHPVYHTRASHNPSSRAENRTMIELSLRLRLKAPIVVWAKKRLGEAGWDTEYGISTLGAGIQNKDVDF